MRKQREMLMVYHIHQQSCIRSKLMTHILVQYLNGRNQAIGLLVKRSVLQVQQLDIIGTI